MLSSLFFLVSWWIKVFHSNVSILCLFRRVSNPSFLLIIQFHFLNTAGFRPHPSLLYSLLETVLLFFEIFLNFPIILFLFVFSIGQNFFNLLQLELILIQITVNLVLVFLLLQFCLVGCQQWTCVFILSCRLVQFLRNVFFHHQRMNLVAKVCKSWIRNAFQHLHSHLSDQRVTI